MNAISTIIALIVLILFSSFFSASETAFSSMNRIRVKNLASGGDKRAQNALTLAERYDELLSSILIGNNIVNILSSSLATVLFVSLIGNSGVTVATIVMTLLVLVFGEITPKTIAKEMPERFAMAATPLLRVFVFILTPFNLLFAAWKRLILRIFKVTSGDAISEEELLTYVEEARQYGSIDAREEGMIRSVIEFDDLQAHEICTPRVDIYAIPVGESPENIARIFHETGYSRLPVYEGDIDNIIGMLLEKDFYYYVQALGEPVEKIVRPTLFAAKTVKISRLLTELQQNKIHMAVIVDEYGGTLGIVTIEDILEELVGEIWDEHDDVLEDIEPLGDDRFRVSGGASLDDVFALFGLDADASSLTVGGWVFERLGAIPEPGTTFDFAGLSFSVEKLTRNRIESVLVERPEADSDAQ